MKKIIYFTAGVNPTAGELAEIALLNNLTSPGYSVSIRNGAESASFGYGKEVADLVAGTVPTSHAANTVYSGIDAAKPTGFVLSPNTAAIVGTATKQLTPIAITGTDLSSLGASALADNVTYVSSVPAKATVDVNGLITGVAAGNTVITATYTYASGKTITATCAVTVS
jgi:uncharacterized protein YjdB